MLYTAVLTAADGMPSLAPEALHNLFVPVYYVTAVDLTTKAHPLISLKQLCSVQHQLPAASWATAAVRANSITLLQYSPRRAAFIMYPIKPSPSQMHRSAGCTDCERCACIWLSVCTVQLTKSKLRRLLKHYYSVCVHHLQVLLL
jgi:hypothetical protein